MRFLTVTLSLGVLFVGVALQTGCGAALGPGFGHAARQIEISPADSESLHVRVTDRLVNAGNRSLTFLDVNLPAKVAAEQDHLAIRVDDHAANTSTFGPGAPVRIIFDPPWKIGEQRTIVMQYDLHPDNSGRGIVADATNGFDIADREMFPAWAAPYGIFATGDSRARTEYTEITAPPDFRVLGAGRRGRASRDGTRTIYRFSARRADASVYAIAGRFQERRVETPDGPVIFWTFQSLDAKQAQAAANRLAAAAATYRDLFGRVPKRFGPIRVVEMPASETAATLAEARAESQAASSQPKSSEDSDVGIGSGIDAASFPQGVLLDERLMAQGVDAEPVLERAEYEMARTWFGWYAKPSAESQILLGRGMSLYAVTRAEAARGGDAARAAAVARLLADYESARLRAEDGPLLRLPPDATPEKQTTHAYKSALFLVALEDSAGRGNFDGAVRRILRATTGKDIDVDELRSALEAATGHDFAELFRLWLNRPGIPDDFRQRYAVAGVSAAIAGQ
jgi:hypothetical protein